MLASRDATLYNRVMRVRCSICRGALPEGRHRYCSERCAREARKRRRRRRSRRAHCKWCGQAFRAARRGHRFCKQICRQAAHRDRRRRPVHWPIVWDAKNQKNYWPQVPVPSWVEIHTDTGHGKGAWWGAAVAWCHKLGGERVELVRLQGRIEPYYSGPTVPEGIAVIYALRWLANAEARGEVAADAPVVLVQDNRAVASKLESGSRYGRFAQVWAELDTLLRPVRESGRLRVRQVRTWNNRADPLARPHADPIVWQVEQQLAVS